MSIASLIGDKSFNFPELIEKDFFKILQGSEYEWIFYLIHSFNSAKVDQFISMLDKYASQIKNDVKLIKY